MIKLIKMINVPMLLGKGVGKLLHIPLYFAQGVKSSFVKDEHETVEDVGEPCPKKTEPTDI